MAEGSHTQGVPLRDARGSRPRRHGGGSQDLGCRPAPNPRHEGRPGEGPSTEEGSTPSVDSETLARFLEEAQLTGQLNHPGIVPVHELGLDSEGRVYFTMRLVKGRDLRKILDLVREGSEGWNQSRALGVLLKACEAMAYAHAKGVIHRDLKPANVMVGRFGDVYVMDWGLARVLGREDRKDIRLPVAEGLSSGSVKTVRDEGEATLDSPLETMDEDVVGTPAYMAPEQATTDIEALCAAHPDLAGEIRRAFSGPPTYVSSTSIGPSRASRPGRRGTPQQDGPLRARDQS